MAEQDIAGLVRPALELAVEIPQVLYQVDNPNREEVMVPAAQPGTETL